jgi:hypothetical protein
VLKKKVAKKVTRETPKLSWGREKLSGWLERRIDTNKLCDLLEGGRNYGIEKDGFPDCCAFDLIYNFPYDNGFPSSLKLSSYAAHLGIEIFDSGPSPFMLATTTQEQSKVGKCLKMLGFKALSTQKNPNSNNMVTLWQGSTKP